MCHILVAMDRTTMIDGVILIVVCVFTKAGREDQN